MHISVKPLKSVGADTSNGGIVWYVNYISISCVLQKNGRGKHFYFLSNISREEGENSRQRGLAPALDKAVERADLLSPFSGHATSSQMQPRLFNAPMAQKQNLYKAKG